MNKSRSESINWPSQVTPIDKVIRNTPLVNQPTFETFVVKSSVNLGTTDQGESRIVAVAYMCFNLRAGVIVDYFELPVASYQVPYVFVLL